MTSQSTSLVDRTRAMAQIPAKRPLESPTTPSSSSKRLRSLADEFDAELEEIKTSKINLEIANADLKEQLRQSQAAKASADAAKKKLEGHNAQFRTGVNFLCGHLNKNVEGLEKEKEKRVDAERKNALIQAEVLIFAEHQKKAIARMDNKMAQVMREWGREKKKMEVELKEAIENMQAAIEK